ncbi:hypothetical protein HY450_02280 [Candidatus Pacearchaeota archaeon]|nr:hypothetical protein [Candidatus Pacearchaeota archaeon]
MGKEIAKIATRENLLEIMKEVKRKMGSIQQIIKEYNIFFSNKNLSEILGKVMEKTASEYFTKKLGYEVKNALSDKEPDLFFTKTNLSMEIKITSTTNAWTGGEFSKRPFSYFMVSWGGDFDEFFVCVIKLDKEDWKSNMASNYYGPILALKKFKCCSSKRFYLKISPNKT